MMKRVILCLVGLSVCYGCGNAESASEKDAIAGTYVREYSREILNQTSGSKLGMRTVRDTLYISSQGEGYQVKNVKWSMNDYDNDGWRDMKHSESKPLPLFNATYDSKSRTLNGESAAPDLVLSEDGKLSVGGKSDIAYAKVD
jgi:hypothetical protein